MFIPAYTIMKRESYIDGFLIREVNFQYDVRVISLYIIHTVDQSLIHVEYQHFSHYTLGLLCYLTYIQAS